MHGQAVVDLTSNQVITADANMNIDLDVSDGRDSLRANGSLRIVLNRRPAAAKK
jgi:hypothetical protein